TIKSADGRIAVDLPADCLSGETWIRILTEDPSDVDPATPQGFMLGTTWVRIEAVAVDGTPVSALLQSATLTVWYSDDDLAAVKGDPNNLVLAYYDEAAADWKPLDTTVNTTDKTLSATTNHFSTWAVLAKSPSEGLAGWIWIVIGIAGAAGAGIVAYFLRRRLLQKA
ncbi:MAG: hypothetical protein NTZ04_00535, partial [Chloroflexi bacterium]|nr:hypothetical protein [Chloroflexota bacterium]